MGDRWQLQEAKNRLSELVRKARDEGPQVITVHGADAAVVMSAEQYAKLSRRKGTLVDFLQKITAGGRGTGPDTQSRPRQISRHMNYLLDTSAVSEVVKPHPDSAVIEWLTQADEETLFLSVLTIGELEKGIAKLADGKRRTRLHAWVRRDLVARFAGRLLPVDLRVADRWGALARRV